MTNTANLIKKYTELDNAQQTVEAWEVLQELKNLPPQISVEAVEKLRERIKNKQKNDMCKYNNVNTKWIDRTILLAITTVQDTFISQLDILLSQQQQDDTN